MEVKMKPEDMKTFTRRYHDEAWNQSKIAVIDEIFAPSYTGQDLATGQTASADDLKQAILNLRASYSDGHIEIDDFLVEGDRAAFRWTMIGTNPQSQLEKHVGITMYTFVDGKVVEDYFLSAAV